MHVLRKISFVAMHSLCREKKDVFVMQRITAKAPQFYNRFCCVFTVDVIDAPTCSNTTSQLFTCGHGRITKGKLEAKAWNILNRHVQIPKESQQHEARKNAEAVKMTA